MCMGMGITEEMFCLLCERERESKGRKCVVRVAWVRLASVYLSSECVCVCVSEWGLWN